MAPKICPLLAIAVDSCHPNHQAWTDSWRCQEGECAWWTGASCAVTEIASKPKTAKEYFQRGCVALATEIVMTGDSPNEAKP